MLRENSWNYLFHFIKRKRWICTLQIHLFRFINRANVLLILIFLIQKSPYRILNNPLLQDSKQSQDIIQIRHYQQQNQDTETDKLGTLHELIAWLATGNDLIQQEEDMTAIQCRNRQDVHKRQDDAQEGCHHPERMPVPHRWEQTAQCAETA